MLGTLEATGKLWGSDSSVNVAEPSVSRIVDRVVVASSSSPKTAGTVDTTVLAMSPLSVPNTAAGARVAAIDERVVVTSPTSTRAVEAVAMVVLKMSESTVFETWLKRSDVVSSGSSVVASVTPVEMAETAGSRRLEAVESTVLTTSVASATEVVAAISDGRLDIAPPAMSTRDDGDTSKTDVGFKIKVSTEPKVDESEGKRDVSPAATEDTCAAWLSRGGKVDRTDGTPEVRLAATDGTIEARLSTEVKAELADSRSGIELAALSRTVVVTGGRSDVKLAATEDRSEARLSTVPRADVTDGRLEVKPCTESSAVAALEATPDTRLSVPEVRPFTLLTAEPEADAIAERSDARLCTDSRAVAASGVGPVAKLFTAELGVLISPTIEFKVDVIAGGSGARLCDGSNGKATLETTPDAKLCTSEVNALASLSIGTDGEAIVERSEATLLTAATTVVPTRPISDDKEPIASKLVNAEVRLATSLVKESKAGVMEGTTDARLAAELARDETAGTIWTALLSTSAVAAESSVDTDPMGRPVVRVSSAGVVGRLLVCTIAVDRLPISDTPMTSAVTGSVAVNSDTALSPTGAAVDKGLFERTMVPLSKAGACAKRVAEETRPVVKSLCNERIVVISLAWETADVTSTMDTWPVKLSTAGKSLSCESADDTPATSPLLRLSTGKFEASDSAVVRLLANSPAALSTGRPET